jgi:hypothetical protein
MHFRAYRDNLQRDHDPFQSTTIMSNHDNMIADASGEQVSMDLNYSIQGHAAFSS